MHFARGWRCRSCSTCRALPDEMCRTPSGPAAAIFWDPVALAAHVTVNLPRNRGVTTPDPRRDRPTALTAPDHARSPHAPGPTETPLRTLPRRRLHPARRGDIPTHVLRPGAELARHPPQRSPITPHLPDPLLLALGQPESSHRGDHLHQPGSQASRRDVQVVRRPPESAAVYGTLKRYGQDTARRLSLVSP
jgi:hypothetical protein